MARNFNVPKVNYSEHEKIMIDQFIKQQNTPVYCRICGKEILNLSTANNDDTVPGDRERGEHTGCRRAKNIELAEKARKEMEAEAAARAEAQRKALEKLERKQNMGGNNQ
jgi:hypothetical protein